MSLSKICLPFLVGQVGRLVAVAGIQLDLAVAARIGNALRPIHVDQDHEAVVEAGPAHAPLVEQCLGVDARRVLV